MNAISRSTAKEKKCMAVEGDSGDKACNTCIRYIKKN
jgi:hypothetical protein